MMNLTGYCPSCKTTYQIVPGASMRQDSQGHYITVCPNCEERSSAKVKGKVERS